jgi:hypothetical protein
MRPAGSASDLVDDREVAVPRELVFEACTVPEHVATLVRSVLLSDNYIAPSATITSPHR